MYICVINIVKKKIKKQFSTCHIVYMVGVVLYFKSSCCTYILVWRCEKNSIQTKYLEFMRTDMHSIIQDYGKVYGQYLEFMWTEIHSIIQKISIPMFSLCDKNQYRHKPWIFFFTKISISCELCSAFVIIIKAHKGNVVTGHGFF